VDTGETRTQFAIFAPKGMSDPEFLEQVVAAYDGTAWVVANEDYKVSAEGYASLQHAPKGMKVYYGRNEIALQHLHRGIAASIGVPPP